VSDVVCPWCIIGYRQLQRALEMMPGQFDVTLRWHPFELNPGMSAEGQNMREHLAQKYGSSAEQGRAARTRLTDMGISLGFEFKFSDDSRMVNTFSAHQLLHWAAEQGLQTELKLALFAAFFSRGLDVSDHSVLIEAAHSVGLDRDRAGEILATAEYAETVRTEQQYWLDREVFAVPSFTFNDGVSVPGAQEPATFVKLLTRLVERQSAD
jgi:predicted DsbA family dithiol-disulfide isomerase